MAQREGHRYPVEFNGFFATANAIEGLGVVTDMSAGGCRIAGRTRKWPGTAMKVHISNDEMNLHIRVAKAEVRWARGTQFGLEFKEISDEENIHLQQALAAFEKTRRI